MKTTLALVAASALAACSNGGSAPPPAGPELSVLSIAPGAGEVVDTLREVEVVFGEALDPDLSRLFDGFVVADDSGPLAGTILFDDAAHRLAFTPYASYALGMHLHVTLSTRLRGVSGATLASDRTVTFRAVDGAVRAPFTIGDGDLGPPRSAAMSFGGALVAQGTRVWGIDETGIVGTATLADPVQSVSLDTFAGRASALCLATGPAHFRASVAIGRASGSWSAPVTVVEQDQLLAGISLVANSREDLAVRWVARTPSTPTTPATVVEGVARSYFDPSLAPRRFDAVEVGPASLVRYLDLDGEGRLFHGVPGNAGVQVSRVDAAGQTFDLPIAAPGAELAGLRADGAGRMLALYVTGSGATRDLRSRRYDPAAGLGTEQVCFAGEATPVSFALGDRGDGVVALAVPDGGQNDLWAVTCLGRTGAWSPAQRLLTGALEFADGGFVAAAVSPRGTTWLSAVVPQPGNVQELVLFRSGAGGTFDAPLHVDTSEPGVRFLRPALAADAGGRAVLFWQERQTAPSVTGPLRVARFE